jgi:hypothetical protein
VSRDRVIDVGETLVNMMRGPRVGARCACGKTFAPMPSGSFAAVLEELQQHVRREHPEAIGHRLTMLVEPIAVRSEPT